MEIQKIMIVMMTEVLIVVQNVSLKEELKFVMIIQEIMIVVEAVVIVMMGTRVV